MFEHKKILAVITARGGSKGVPRKNIRKIADKPLIVWTIEEADKSNYLDKVILSSEDDEIINIAIKSGCDVPFIRPKILSGDNIAAVEVALHAIETLSENYDYVVQLQPTSPLRIAEDIDACIKLCAESKAPACVSVAEVEKHPFWMYKILGDGKLKSFSDEGAETSQRQGLPELYALNGAIYVAQTEWFVKKKKFITSETLGFRMPKERSLDIDTEFDFMLGDFLLRRR